MDGSHLACKLFILFERERLRAVRESPLGLIVDFDDKTVGAAGDARARERRDHMILARAVRGVDDYGEVRDALDGGHGREVERVARMLRECAYAALAEN